MKFLAHKKLWIKCILHSHVSNEIKLNCLKQTKLFYFTHSDCYTTHTIIQIWGCRQGSTSASWRQHDTTSTATTRAPTATDRSPEAVTAADVEYRRLPQDARSRSGSADAATVITERIDTIESPRSVRVPLSERAAEISRLLSAVDRTFRFCVRRRCCEDDSGGHPDDFLRRAESRGL